MKLKKLIGILLVGLLLTISSSDTSGFTVGSGGTLKVGSGGNFLLTNPGGTTWLDTGVDPVNSAWCFGNFGGGIVTCGVYGNDTNPGSIFRSTNYGVDWTDLGQQGIETCIYSMIGLSGGIGLAGTESYPGGGTGGIILRTTNSGTNWNSLGQQSSQTSIRCFADFGSGVVVAGTSPHAIPLRSTDSGANWTSPGYLDYPTVTMIQAMIGLEDGKGLLAGWGPANNIYIYKTTDSGANWSYVTTWTGKTWTQHFCDLGGGIVLAGTAVPFPGSASIMRTTDYGDNWTELEAVCPGEGSIFGFANFGSGVVVAGTDIHGHIIRSINWGLNWTDLGQQFSQSAIMDIVNLGNNIGIAGTEPGKILRSTYSVASIPIGLIPFVIVSNIVILSLAKKKKFDIKQARWKDFDIKKAA